LSQTDGAAAAARQARAWLEELLEAPPVLADLLPPGFADAVEAYVELLLRANRRLNLTRVTEPREVARLHLIDSIAALPWIDASGASSAVDLGSGGGLPGIPLAIARPAVAWRLIDAVGKKAAVLEEFVTELRLSNVTVIAERAETLGQSSGHRERHGLVAARACATLPVLAELALPLLSLGGTLLAWKGPLNEADEELRRGQAAAASLGGGPLRVEPAGAPALGGHTFVIGRKERPTPPRYPRRPGEPGRRPLG
jgi:16S rRNA (guanine527-N7)-methyltransferase